MNERINFLVICFIFYSATCNEPEDLSFSLVQNNFLIQGTVVYNQYPNTPVPKALVKCANKEAYTDSDGKFYLIDIPGGIQNIEVSSDEIEDFTEKLEVKSNIIKNIQATKKKYLIPASIGNCWDYKMDAGFANDSTITSFIHLTIEKDTLINNKKWWKLSPAWGLITKHLYEFFMQNFDTIFTLQPPGVFAYTYLRPKSDTLSYWITVQGDTEAKISAIKMDSTISVCGNQFNNYFCYYVYYSPWSLEKYFIVPGIGIVYSLQKYWHDRLYLYEFKLINYNLNNT